MLNIGLIIYPFKEKLISNSSPSGGHTVASGSRREVLKVMEEQGVEGR